MKGAWRLAVGVLLATACERPGASPSYDTRELASREQRFAASLASTPDSAHDRWKPIARWYLPPELAEISGLAFTPDGRLLAHGDERSIVSEIDYRRGVIVKQFVLGKRPVRGDFEGIAVVGDTVYLMTSDGDLYAGPEGAKGAHVLYTVYETGLGRLCEAEGLTYDPDGHDLLLGCKNPRKKDLKGKLAVYRWQLPRGPLSSQPAIMADLKPIEKAADLKSVSPSSIDRDPASGNFVILSGPDHALVETTPDGAPITTHTFTPEEHPQPEGAAFGPDGILVIADEAARGRAVLTVYRWH